jgi:hypothetical protein
MRYIIYVSLNTYNHKHPEKKAQSQAPHMKYHALAKIMPEVSHSKKLAYKIYA